MTRGKDKLQTFEGFLIGWEGKFLGHKEGSKEKR